MNKRRRRNRRSQQPQIWPWITFGLFSLVLALLGYSVFKKQSPAKTLRQVFTTEKDANDLTTYGKKDLLQMAESQKSELEQLRNELEACRQDDGLQKAIIETASPTLNMRSEASLESDIVLKIPNGTRVSILYYDERDLFLEGAMGRWCYIQHADQKGWVWGNYLKPQ